MFDPFQLHAQMMKATAAFWLVMLTPPRQPIRRWSQLTPAEQDQARARWAEPAPTRLNSFGAFQR